MKTRTFINEHEIQDQVTYDFSNYYSEELGDIITLVLDPIDNFIRHMDETVKDKDQDMIDTINILYALTHHAYQRLMQYSTDIEKHLGGLDVVYRRNSVAGFYVKDAAGVEIRHYAQETDKEVMS
jgi:hypothetical protein